MPRLASRSTWTVHVDETRDDRRFVGDVAFHYLGAWQVRGIVEVPSESLVTGDLGGFWRGWGDLAKRRRTSTDVHI